MASTRSDNSTRDSVRAQLRGYSAAASAPEGIRLLTLRQARCEFALDHRMIYRAAALGLVHAYQDAERPRSRQRYSEIELRELARLLGEDEAAPAEQRSTDAA